MQHGLVAPSTVKTRSSGRRRQSRLVPAPTTLPIALVIAATLFPGTPVAGQSPELVSVNSSGTNSGNFISGSVTTGRSPVVSDDGRMVAFESRATDLVALTDANGDAVDVFVRDVFDHQTELVSVNTAGTASGSGGSSDPVISGDGQWVAFVSGADDLVAEDTSGAVNVFVRDVVGGVTYLVSRASGGGSGGNADSDKPVLSRDGRWVLFESEATNLTTVSDTNGRTDLFAWFRDTGAVELVTVDPAGTASGSGFPGNFSPTLSDPVGQFVRVAFSSTFTNLVGSDLNGHSDVFVRDLPGGPTVSLTQGADGGSEMPRISATGDWVAFTSNATGLVANDSNEIYDCYLHDGAGTILVSRNAAGTDSGNDRSACEGVNADRGFVVFTSYASDLVATDTNAEEDVFIREIRPATTSLVSVNAAGTDSANSFSSARDDQPPVSANGRFVVFESYATDLEGINGDGDGDGDVYVRDHCLGTTTLMNPNTTGTASGNNESDFARISRNGRWVVFSSRATNLDSLDGNGWIDAYRAEVPGWSDSDCGALDLFRDGFETGDTQFWSASNP